MGYMRIQKHTKDELYLLREPTLLSKAVFVGFFAGILGIFLFGSECLFFKVLIGLCAAGLSFCIVDNYEICEFDKTVSEVRLIRLHWCQYLLTMFNCISTPPYVTAKLEDIKDVRVEEQGGPSSGKAYQVILSLENGILLGVTEVFTTDDISDHETIANIIRNFLDESLPSKWEDEADDEDEDEVSTSEDDFEQISRADLEGLEEEDLKAAEGNAPPTEKIAGGDSRDTPPVMESDPAEKCDTSTS